MRALAPVLTNDSTAKSLYAIEEQLAALMDTADLVSPAEEQEFRKEFQLALNTAIEKRDRVGQFMAHLESQIAFTALEMNRLRDRKRMYERALERIEDYVIGAIQMLGMDMKGRYRDLEGRTVTFSLGGCPPSVEITDESTVPAMYKTLTLRLPMATWERILSDLKVETRQAITKEVRCEEISIDKRSIAAAVNAGATVSGADLNIGKMRLRRK